MMVTITTNRLEGQKTVKILGHVAKICGYLGGIAIIVLLVIMVLDVVLRRFFGRPIVGATEVAQLSMVFIFLAAPLTTLENRHIKVDTLMDVFPKKVQVVIDIIIYLLTIVMCTVMGWRAYQMSHLSRRLEVDYSLLKIPEYPMLWVLAASFFLIAIMVMGQLIKKVGEVTNK
jgi:TRAP-type C4-dicarboxylate transport system permease small subunit